MSKQPIGVGGGSSASGGATHADGLRQLAFGERRPYAQATHTGGDERLLRSRWRYAPHGLNNPLKYTDPTGHLPCPVWPNCEPVTPPINPDYKAQDVLQFQVWEEHLGAEVIYSETNNGQYSPTDSERIGHALINRTQDSRWGSMANAAGTTAIIDELWGDRRLATIEATTEDWFNGLERHAKNPAGWRNAQVSFGKALNEARAGYDPTGGALFFTALGRTEASGQFRADYERIVANFQEFAEDNPDFVWSVTPYDMTYVVDGNRIAVFASNHPCVWKLSCGTP